MKKMLCLMLLAPLYTLGQQISAADSVQISSIIKDWDDAWNSKNAVLASKWYSADARFTNAFGDKMKGQAEIQKLLTEVFSLSFVMSGQSETVAHQYQNLNGNNVIVHTNVIRKGQRMPDGATIPDRQTTHMRVFQKTGNAWIIKAHLISDARDKQAPKH